MKRLFPMLVLVALSLACVRTSRNEKSEKRANLTTKSRKPIGMDPAWYFDGKDYWLI